jgi:DNA-binding response OmpR family regulator
MSEARRILVVDDDPSIRNFLTVALTEAGFHVEEAVDGCAALDRVVASTFDIIVLDLQMPRMDGRTFLDSYSRRDGNRAQVIVCSARVGVDLTVGALPADGFLQKPFELRELYAAVEQCLDSTEAPYPGSYGRQFD